jgi:hypothetical protein
MVRNANRSLKILDDLQQELVPDGILKPAGDAPAPEAARKPPKHVPDALRRRAVCATPRNISPQPMTEPI